MTCLKLYRFSKISALYEHMHACILTCEWKYVFLHVLYKTQVEHYMDGTALISNQVDIWCA